MASCTYNPGVDSYNPYAVLNVTQKSQNVDTNKTVVRWELLLYRPSTIQSSAPKAYSIVIDGVTVKTGTTTIGGRGTLSIASGTREISHNSDGSKSISFSFSLAFDITWSGRWVGTGSANGRMDLTALPRSTTPTLNPITLEAGKTMTISLNRASASFTHTLTWQFGSKSGTIGTGLTTYASFTPGYELLYEIPNAISGRGTVTCTTYNGGTVIGSKSAEFTLNVPDNIVPRIHSVQVSEGVAEISNKFRAYVKDKSRFNIVSDVSGQYGSTVSSCVVTVLGQTYSGDGVRTEIITASGSVPIEVKVTDSRGRIATKTVTVSVLDYAAPKINTFSVVRGNAYGKEDAEGTYALITLDFSISPVNNINSKSYKIEYKTVDETSWRTLGTWYAYSYKGTMNGGNILNTDNAYMFRLTVTDYFASVVADNNNTPTAFTLIDFNASGNSIAFGGVSTRDENEKVIDFKIDVYDKFGTRVNNGLANYAGSGASGIDPDTTIEELILTNNKMPNGEFFYITTVFYDNKTVTSNRAQTAIPYNSNGSMYHRYFYNGSWTAWRRHINEDEDVVVKVNENEWYRKYSNGVLEYYFANRKLTSFPNINVGNVWCGFAVKFIDTNYSVSAMRSSGGNASDSLDIMPTYDKRVDQVGIYAHSKSGAMAYNTARIITFDIQCKGFWK